MRRGPIAVAVVGLLAFVACSQGERKLVRTQGPALRGADGRSVAIGVDSCNGDPSVEVEESDLTVIVRVTAYVPNGDRDDCADIATVTLDRPLGERQLIDGVTGDEIPVSST